MSDTERPKNIRYINPIGVDPFQSGLDYNLDPELDNVVIDRIFILRQREQPVGTIFIASPYGRDEMQLTADVDQYLVKAFNTQGKQTWYKLSELPSTVTIADYPHEMIADLAAMTIDPEIREIIELLEASGSKRLTVDTDEQLKQKSGDPSYRTPKSEQGGWKFHQEPSRKRKNRALDFKHSINC